MFSRLSVSHYLISLSERGDTQQLSTALRWPTLTQAALETESVLVAARTGTVAHESTIHRMLCAAAQHGHEDIVELLLAFGLEHGLTAGEMITTNTMDARFNLKPLEVLLKFKAVDYNVFHHPLHLGADILYIACWGGPNEDDAPRGKWLGFVKHLLEVEGRDANTPNAAPGTRRHRPGRLLRIACREASVEIVECLLHNGAIVEGSQAMRTASCLGRVDVLEVLLKYGGDVNELAEQETVDGPPGSPLHVAAAAGRKNVCEWLVRHGADETLRNREGKTPKDIDYSHS